MLGKREKCMPETIEVIGALRFRALVLQGSPIDLQYVVTLTGTMNNVG